MRVDPYNQISQVYKTGKTIKTKRTVAASPLDKVQISSGGYDYQIAKQAVAKAPDIREDRVATLKAAISSGSYEVSGDDFATKLLEKYNEKNNLL